MIYRMLVLNTGQVPWTLARQLSVVFDPLISEIITKVPELEKIIGPDKAGRRIGPAQYSGDTLVEIYLAFSIRKTSLDTKEALLEEFSRIDFVDNLSRAGFQNQFYDSLTVLAKLDRAFSRYDPKTGSPDRYVRGRNIFDSQPARIGLMVGIAQHVLGRPGMERREDEAEQRMKTVTRQADKLISILDGRSAEEVGEFLSLDVLRQRLKVRTGQVGRFERAFFFEAFRVLIEEQFSVQNMEPCWLAN